MKKDAPNLLTTLMLGSHDAFLESLAVIKIKNLGILRQHWALIPPGNSSDVVVNFVSDESVIFDQISYPTREQAEAELGANGFIDHDPSLHTYIYAPAPPYQLRLNPLAGYSSGLLWLHGPRNGSQKTHRVSLLVNNGAGYWLTSDRNDFYLLPGGRLEAGETILASASRLLQLKAGLIARSLIHIFNYESETTFHSVVLVVTTGSPRTNSVVPQAKFATISSPDHAIKTSPATRRILQMAEQRKMALHQFQHAAFATSF